MEGERVKYPCKAFPYKKFPTYIKYPCEGKEKEEEEEKKNEPEVIKRHSLVTVEQCPTQSDEPKQPCLQEKRSFPHLRSGVYKKSTSYTNFIHTSKWNRQFLTRWEREKEKLICTRDPPMDSYERLCMIPVCKPKVEEVVVVRKPFNPLHCVFCDKSLYYHGTIHDLKEKVPPTKKISETRQDEIAYRIGIRTRITVHKKCFEEYIQQPIIIKESNSASCISNQSKTESEEAECLLKT